MEEEPSDARCPVDDKEVSGLDSRMAPIRWTTSAHETVWMSACTYAKQGGQLEKHSLDGKRGGTDVGDVEEMGVKAREDAEFLDGEGKADDLPDVEEGEQGKGQKGGSR